MRFERRTRSCCSSSAKWDHSRSAMTAGSPASTGRNRCGSVRSPPAATRASRRSSFAPARLMRSRSRSSCLGLIAYTAKPRSRRASTTGPCGTSIATATEPGSPAADTSQSHRAARPAPPCANARSPTTLPALSSRQTWCFAEPQSTPANQRNVSSAMVLSSRVPRAVTTPAGTCMGARGRDFLLGIRRGQPAGAQIHVWCSWHEGTDGRSRQAGSHGQLTHALIVPVPDTGARIRGGGRNDPCPVLGSGDADGLRASQLQHAVQDRDGDVHLGGLTLVRTRAQPVPDHALEPANGGLGAGTPVISRRLLPAHPAPLGDELEVAVALGGGRLGRRAGHGGRTWWDDDGRRGMALADAGVDAVLVVRAVACDGGHCACDLVEQGANL